MVVFVFVSLAAQDSLVDFLSNNVYPQGNEVICLWLIE